MIYPADSHQFPILRSDELMVKRAMRQQFVGPSEKTRHLEIWIRAQILRLDTVKRRLHRAGGNLEGLQKKVRMPMATTMATKNTSTLSRQSAYGYGLIHLVAVFSRASICFCKAASSASASSAALISLSASSRAETACGERMSRWEFSSFWTCLRMSAACRTVREMTHRNCIVNQALSTSIKASCGMLTEPKDFIRFFPSFCFSSNLRLREMSPP